MTPPISEANRAVRVGIDLTGMSPLVSGVRTRAEAMIAALAALPNEVELHILSSDRWAAELASELGLCLHDGPRTSQLSRLLGTGRRIRAFVAECDLDVVQLEASPVPRRSPVPVILSLHDLRSYEVKFTSLRSLDEIFQRAAIARSARRASAVLALTRYMAGQLEEHLGLDLSKIVVIPPGRPTSIPEQSLSDADGTGRHFSFGRYVLCLGHLEARKNLEVMVAATADPTWPDDVTLVLAGRDGGSMDRLIDMAATSAQNRCRFIGPVDDADKWALLRGALAVAIPSTIEGFGIVALEASAVGVPVLAADASALPEVVGVLDTLLPPDSPSSWADGVARLAGDDEWRRRVVVQQVESMRSFSWAISAGRLASLYRMLSPRR